MPAYMIFLRETPVRDAAAMAEYSRLNRQDIGAFPITPLAIYGAVEALEGDAPDGVVILQFPSVEAARAWYNSPGYQAALAHRKKAADYRALIVEGV